MLTAPPTPHPSILALGYSEAAMVLGSRIRDDIGGIISIRGHQGFAVDCPTMAVSLVLEFDDVDVPPTDDPSRAYESWAREKWAKEIGRPQTPPRAVDAAAIIEFARRLKDCRGTVLCHCQAGVSRSPAVALLCLATWTGPGHERYCVEHLRRVRPCAVPHRGLIVFGDDLLGRGGKLVEAVIRSMNKS
jgi:predicted protein tyrosine phosphatase